MAHQSHTDTTNLAQSLRLKWQSTYPFLGTFRNQPFSASFTIRMDDGCYDYMRFDDDPGELFQDVEELQHDIRKTMAILSPVQEEKLERHLLEMMARFVFGSNLIEAAGASYDITLPICQKILSGELVDEDINEGDPDYGNIKSSLLERNLPAGMEAIIQSRREIVQHARALRHIVTQMILLDTSLSEELILSTHKILTYKVLSSDGEACENYSGRYREEDVGCGFTNFTHPNLIPTEMGRLVRDFNNDVELAAEAGALDPFALAAKYCHLFVNIHPFLDGNGRTCRLILNVILLKYAGIMVSLGETDGDRDEYLGVAGRASEAELSAHDDDDDEAKPKHWKELSTLTLRHAKQEFEGMFKVLSS